MVTKKKASAKKGVAKLKLKKETIRDLDVRGKSARVKGGLKRKDTDNDCSVGCTGITCTVCPF
jgi:hypothetical protein